MLDVSDVCEYLGKNTVRWYPSALAYGRSTNRWIAVPLGSGGNCMNYRESHLKAAGFKEFPKDIAGFLKLCQALKKNGTPPGFALGNATGDANGWCHWLLWAFGGRMVDDKNKVAINSKETAAALEFAREMYPTLVPGTLSWLDPNNNKAFLSGEISLTNNGISIYYAAKNSPDPKLKALAADIQHANFPIGPAGHPTESALFFTSVIFKYSKYPERCQGISALHDGARTVRAVAEGRLRFRDATVDSLRKQPGVDRRSKEHAVQVELQEHAAERIRG